MQKKKLAEVLWDLWCIVSVVGIWPRFIEPHILSSTALTLKIEGLSRPLRIAQFSDLHLNFHSSARILTTLQKRIAAFRPDLVLYCGDYLCCSLLPQPERLKDFLNSLPQAPLGNYAIFGNHDYARYVTINEQGDYDIQEGGEGPGIKKAFSMLFSSRTLSKKVTERAQNTPLHDELAALLSETSFRVLHNETIALPGINITGLGEYSLGKMQPETAFKNYDRRFPGIILLHNPDGAVHLGAYPGDVVLSGHTHGGQVNLPWLWKKFTLMEQPDLKRGLANRAGKWIYINRGIGSVIPFRWFAVPELLELTLEPL